MPVVRRPVAISVVVLALLAGCSDDEEPEPALPAAPLDTSQPAGPVTVAITPLGVTVRDRGATPREILEQDLAEDQPSVGELTFDLQVEEISNARIVGDNRLDVMSFREGDATATVEYALSGLDVALAESGEPTDPIEDALSLTGTLQVGPDRGVTAATIDTQASGEIPGVEALADSLDPRLTSLLLPFPTEPVGIGAEWTVQGPLPMFGATVSLTAEMQLVERQGNHYVLTAALAMETPTPGSGPEVTLQGIGRLVGDLRRLGLLEGTMGMDGTIGLPGDEAEHAMAVELAVEGRR